MQVAEVFSQNIQTEQIKKIISLDKHNEQGYDEERKHFLYWLKEQIISGYRPTDQLAAWNLYLLYIDIDFEDYDDEGAYWLRDLESSFDNQMRFGNYNEFGGQQ